MTISKPAAIQLLFVLTALYSCHSKDKTGIARQELQLTASLGGVNYQDTTSTIHIATTLFNPTKDTLSFVTMRCSYEDLFLTDTSTFIVHSRYDCYSNYPIVIAIPPGEKLDQYIMVKPTSKNIKIEDHQLKIGMYLLIPEKEKGFQGIIEQYESRKNAKVIWSNELDLKRLYRHLYK